MTTTSKHRPSLANIRAAILDWAGTTVDYGSRAPTQVFIEMFHRRGVEITEAEAREPMGMAKRAHIATIAGMARVNAAWQARHGCGPTSADVDAIYAEFLPLQKSTLADHSDVIPGIPDAIDHLRTRGIKIGSSTGYTRELMDVVIPLAAQGGYSPDVVICSDEVSAGRPAPWMNFRVAELLDVYPMEQVLVVDDTPIGIAAGRAAGAITVAVSQTGNALGLSLEEIKQLPPGQLASRLAEIEADFLACGAHYVIKSVADIAELF
ncbi:MAG: phosphonoacetaldehyde hydrolase [Pirellulaceae bacterium]|nr:phosphonoacetaldehyde hydrolase [Pirellulaceae bacterium]